MSSESRDSFISFFPVWMSFLSFSGLSALSRTYSTMLNKSGKSGHPCLVPDLRGNVFSFEYDIRCGFVMNGLYYFESCSL